MSLKWTLSFPVSIPTPHVWHRATLEENKLKIFKMCPETCLNLWLQRKAHTQGGQPLPQQRFGEHVTFGESFFCSPSLHGVSHAHFCAAMHLPGRGRERYSGIESRKCAQNLGRGRRMEVNQEKHNALWKGKVGKKNQNPNSFSKHFANIAFPPLPHFLTSCNQHSILSLSAQFQRG